ncbi:ADP-ribose pyrophosphatase, mitochondrial isoform X2 [Parasteatoda tepidariorum]|uniref:ADP-ribose pyrophosphatase, mitochondrial isoform X2 n=1 Tax=Parasteatoda tepidariorum TaxID=114398 RepID=UPI0039BD1C64
MRTGKMNAVCRKSAVYPVERFTLPDEKVLWKQPYPDYTPPAYSAPYLNTAPWADPDISDSNFKPKWNAEDNGIDRRSFDNDLVIPYDVVDGYPLNPNGRTGLKGRGRLGRWGPNHAGDAIVSRWKTKNGQKELSSTGKPVLQFIAILRKDCGQWAIPGGFVDPKEASSSAVLRELFEEAIDMKKLSNEVQEALRSFFKCGKQVYKGYVDDPRNTDNAWIETTAINFHDDSGSNTENIILDARDDAVDAAWIDIVPEMSIYPPHYALIECLKKIHESSL